MIHSFGQLCSLADAALIIGLPVLSARLQQIEPVPIRSLSSFLRLYLIIRFGQRIPREVERRIAASLDVFGMIILRLRIFEMRLLVDGMIVIIII